MGTAPLVASNTALLFLIIQLLLITVPICIVFWPKIAGTIGVLTLSAAALMFFWVGSTAMTETTAAVFAVGAFCLAGILGAKRSNN